MAEGRSRKKLTVEYPTYDATKPVYANQMVVQYMGSEFAIAFYAAFPPVLTGTDEERLAQASQIEKIPAICVARVVIPRERMPEIVEALAQNLERSKDPNASPTSG